MAFFCDFGKVKTFDLLVTTYHCLHMCRKHFLLTKSEISAILFQIGKDDVGYIG